MIYILHGLGSNPNKVWIPWLKEELESRTYDVRTPKLPFPLYPSQKKWIKTLDRIIDSESENDFVAYSLSSQTLLRYLAQGKGNPKNIFLVAPFQDINRQTLYDETRSVIDVKPIPEFVKSRFAHRIVAQVDTWCNEPLPWDELKKLEDRMHIFFSSDDPYVNQDQVGLFKSNLSGAKYYVENNAGHFRTPDGYSQFPNLLNAMLDSISGRKD